MLPSATSASPRLFLSLDRVRGPAMHGPQEQQAGNEAIKREFLSLFSLTHAVSLTDFVFALRLIYLWNSRPRLF